MIFSLLLTKKLHIAVGVIRNLRLQEDPECRLTLFAQEYRIFLIWSLENKNVFQILGSTGSCIWGSLTGWNILAQQVLKNQVLSRSFYCIQRYQRTVLVSSANLNGHLRTLNLYSVFIWTVTKSDLSLCRTIDVCRWNVRSWCNVLCWGRNGLPSWRDILPWGDGLSPRGNGICPWRNGISSRGNGISPRRNGICHG